MEARVPRYGSMRASAILLFVLLETLRAELPEPLAEPVSVKDPSGADWIEIRIHKAVPVQKVDNSIRGADLPQIPQAAFLGTIRYVKPGGDFCGKPIPPGVYTMRYWLLPEDGAHQGVAPRRDSVLLSAIEAERDNEARPSYEQLVDMSRKASGTTHPAVLFLTVPEPGAGFPSVRQQGRWRVVQVKSGEVELGIVVAGKAEE